MQIIENYPASQTKMFAPIEVEYIMENFMVHGHNSHQVESIICWDIDDDTSCRCDPGKAYKYYTTMDEHEVPIYVLSKIEGISVRNSTGKRN